MNEPLKTRLVGAAVLLIAGGLLWPLLFNFDESRAPESLSLELPDATQAAADVVSSNDDFSSQSRELSGVDAGAASQAKPEPAVEAPEQRAEKSQAADSQESAGSRDETVARLGESRVPALDNNGIPVAYVVQVGTFGRWENADSFRNALIKSSLKAFTRPETSSQPGPYRVLVGPLLTLDEAKETSDEIRRKHKINDTFIRKFGRN